MVTIHSYILLVKNHQQFYSSTMELTLYDRPLANRVKYATSVNLCMVICNGFTYYRKTARHLWVGYMVCGRQKFDDR